MTSYERIAKAIRLLDESRGPAPDHATMAARSGLSPSRFHRLLADWAGATPEDFLRCLTLSHARDGLQRGAAALAAAPAPMSLDPARRPASRVILEAATADEIQCRGAGLTMHAGVVASPFGHCLIGETSRGICHLAFFDTGERAKAIAEMHAGWPLATVVWNDRTAAGLAARIFAPAAAADASVPWRVFVRGTAFRLCVWRTLLRVPAGALVSYATLAAAAGNPNASRAAGTAVGANPIAFLIPCHRVILATGDIGRYRWGSVRKRAILAWCHSTEPIHAAVSVTAEVSCSHGSGQQRPERERPDTQVAANPKNNP